VVPTFLQTAISVGASELSFNLAASLSPSNHRCHRDTGVAEPRSSPKCNYLGMLHQ